MAKNSRFTVGPQTLTSKAYQDVTNRVQQHILSGGGIVPSPDLSELGDHIECIAGMYFGRERADERFAALIKDFEYQQHEDLWTAMVAIVSAHEDAAFTFGAAVGLQLAQQQPSGPRRVARQASKARVR
jgi:hypothetical protein